MLSAVGRTYLLELRYAFGGERSQKGLARARGLAFRSNRLRKDRRVLALCSGQARSRASLTKLKYFSRGAKDFSHRGERMFGLERQGAIFE